MFVIYAVLINKKLVTSIALNAHDAHQIIEKTLFSCNFNEVFLDLTENCSDCANKYMLHVPCARVLS